MFFVAGQSNPLNEEKTKWLGANTLNFTDAGWDAEVLKSDTPVLVGFLGDVVRPVPPDDAGSSDRTG